MMPVTSSPAPRRWWQPGGRRARSACSRWSPRATSVHAPMATDAHCSELGVASHPATRLHQLAGDLAVTGRLLTASNASFVASCTTPDGDVQLVYKPIRGERELWDFPSGSLAGREVAAYRMSAAGGFDVVPYTTMVDGPFGPGSAQVWVHQHEEDAVDEPD